MCWGGIYGEKVERFGYLYSCGFLVSIGEYKWDRMGSGMVWSGLVRQLATYS